MSGSGSMMFACSKCFSRHPFEELSSGQQLCKECRGAYPIVKCTYCRSEFQQTSKTNTSTICTKCEQSVKSYGKPIACQYCNIIAAFIGPKCQRCTNSEKKYGPAVTCDQCKQRCAFDRHDENKKIDGKLLCWLCMQSYKRVIVKARQVEERRMAQKRPSSEQKQMKDNVKKSQQQQSQQQLQTRSDITSYQAQALPEIPEKVARIGNSGSTDPNSSEHVVAMTQLKEQIASLQKRLQMKDRELLGKDKFITELKSKNFESEIELRNKMKDTEKYFQTKVDLLNKKVASLLKEVAQLSKGTKRGGGSGEATGQEKPGSGNGNSGGGGTSASSSAKDSGGSGSDSPN